jgi:hypothetical protein
MWKFGALSLSFIVCIFSHISDRNTHSSIFDISCVIFKGFVFAVPKDEILLVHQLYNASTGRVISGDL